MPIEPQDPSTSFAEVLAVISAQCPVDTHPSRLPLAFIAAHPAARIAAEMREAQRVVYFQCLPAHRDEAVSGCGRLQKRHHSEAALLLATATTPLPRLQELFSPHPDRTSQGSSRGSCRNPLKAVVKFFSRVQMADVYESYRTDSASDDHDSTTSTSSSDDEEEKRDTFASPVGTASDASTTKPQRKEQQNVAQRRRKVPLQSQLACCGTALGGVASVLVCQRALQHHASQTAPKQRRPSKVVLSSPPKVQHDIIDKVTLREWLQNAQKESPEKKQVGLSTHLIDTLTSFSGPFLFPSTTVAPSTLSLPEAVAFHEKPRGSTLDSDDTVDDHRHKLKTAAATMIASQFLSSGGSACSHKASANAPSNPQTQESSHAGTIYRALYVTDWQTSTPIADVILGVSLWWLSRPIHANELPRYVSAVPCHNSATAPPLHVKFISDTFAMPSWWSGTCLWRLLCYMYALVCRVMAFLLGTSLATMPSTKTSKHRTQDRSAETTLNEARDLGRLLSGHRESTRPVLQSLDASRTSLTGSHLLALANAAAPSKAFLRALDLSGCAKLKLHLPQPTSNSDPIPPVRSDAVPLPLELVCADSNVGLALGNLAYKGGLTWLNVSGAAVNQAAVDALGLYSLLQEVRAHFPSAATTEAKPMCSLVAVNMTSCGEVSSLSAFAFVPSLVQLLVPFCDVNDDSLDGFDGHNFLVKLSRAVHRFKEVMPVGTHELNLIARLAEVKPSPATGANGKGGRDSADAALRTIAADLACRFSSHFYHLDFTFSVGLCDVNELLHTQRALHFLNLSQTRVFGVGLGADVRQKHQEDRHDTSFVCPLHRLVTLASATSTADVADGGCYGKPTTERRQPFPCPLRVLVCDPCDHVDTMQGLTPHLFPRLEKLYLRSGGLSEEGIAAAFEGLPPLSEGARRSSGTLPFSHLVLLDLSYCDKIHDVGVLSRFPVLHTLNLDNTEVTPQGLTHLRSPTGSLKVLSLRYCPEVMDVLRARCPRYRDEAERLAFFKLHISNIPSLEAVLVEME